MVEVDTELRLLDGKIHISIIQDYVWRFTTKLKSNSFQIVFMRVSHDAITNFSGASECNFINISVLTEVLTCGASTCNVFTTPSGNPASIIN